MSEQKENLVEMVARPGLIDEDPGRYKLEDADAPDDVTKLCGVLLAAGYSVAPIDAEWAWMAVSWAKDEAADGWWPVPDDNATCLREILQHLVAKGEGDDPGYMTVAAAQQIFDRTPQDTVGKKLAMGDLHVAKARETMGSASDDPNETVMSDMLGDMMHVCERDGISFWDLYEEACRQYECERKELPP